MPVHEYKCRRCGTVSEYLEKQDEWHLFPRKCKQCGRRRTHRIVSSFSSTVHRTRTETLNELKQMGNVRFVPRHTAPSNQGPPPGGCPYEKMAEEGKTEPGPDKEPPIEVRKG